MKYLPGNTIRPIYKQALIAAVVFYGIANCYLLTDLIFRMGRIEHFLLAHGQ